MFTDKRVVKPLAGNLIIQNRDEGSIFETNNAKQSCLDSPTAKLKMNVYREIERSTSQYDGVYIGLFSPCFHRLFDFKLLVHSVFSKHFYKTQL